MATGSISSPNSVLVNSFELSSQTISARSFKRFEGTPTAISGYVPSGLVGVASVGTSYIMAHFYNATTNKVVLDLYNYSGTDQTVNPIAVVLYVKT